MPANHESQLRKLHSMPAACLLALLLLVGAWGCGAGGGGGGGSASSGGNIMGTLSGISQAAAWTGEAWIEEYPAIRATVASTGAFLLSGVPTEQPCHVIARILFPAGTKLEVRGPQPAMWARSEPILPGHGEITHVLTVLPGEKGLIGYLLDESGKPVTDGTVTFWGITLSTAVDGSFRIPDLPASVGELSLAFQASGRQPCIVSVPMPNVVYPPVFKVAMLPAASENHPPVIMVASAPERVLPGQSVPICVTVDDPDASDVALTPVWESTAGTLLAGSGAMSRIWTAPLESGIATVSIRVTDRAGVTGEAHIAWAVGDSTAVLPRLATFTPQSGVPGSWVTITGTGFVSFAGGSPVVRFNGVSASIKDWSSTRIVAMIPEEAESGPVSVVTTDGVSTGGTFTVVDYPIEMTPVYGPPETVITLKGFGFDADNPGKVIVNGREALILLWSDTSIQARVPRLATTGPVTAEIRGRTHTVAVFTVSKAAAPSPARALRGSTVTLTGAGFGPDQGPSQMWLASGVAITPDSWSENEITFTIPSKAVTGPVSLKIWGLTITSPSLSVEYADKYDVAGRWSGRRLSADPLTPGVAVASDGTVFLSDRNNCVIWKFSPDGSTISKFGSKGEGPGQMLDPWGLLIDRGGDLWISDRGNHRLLKTDQNGNLLRTVGSGIDPLNAPSGMALDADGNIWVADAENNSILKFTTAGTLLRKIDNQDIAGMELDYPNGVAISASGDIYVADTNHNRVQRLDSNGAPIGWWGRDDLGTSGWHPADPDRTGASGTGLVEFNGPMSIGFDGTGKLIVADAGNNRLQVLSLDSGFATQIAAGGAQAGLLDGPTGIAVTGSSVWVADLGNSRAQRFSITGSYEAVRSPALADLLTMSDRIAVDEDRGLVYVSDSAEGLVNVFSTVGEFVRCIGSKGTGEGQMREPSGLHVTADGSLWVVDSGNARLHLFDADGKLLRTFGAYGNGKGQFIAPAGLELLPNTGNLLIADAGNHRLQIVEPDGTWNGFIGSFGHLNGEFDTPRGVAVDEAGSIYVADTGNGRVQKLTAGGTFVGWWGADTSGGDGWHGTDTSIQPKREYGPCRFQGPSDLTVDPEGSIFVVDGAAGVMQKFSPEHETADMAGFLVSVDLDAGFRGVAVDTTGLVYLTALDQVVRTMAPSLR